MWNFEKKTTEFPKALGVGSFNSQTRPRNPSKAVICSTGAAASKQKSHRKRCKEKRPPVGPNGTNHGAGEAWNGTPHPKTITPYTRRGTLLLQLVR